MAAQTPVQPVTPPRRRPIQTPPPPITLKELADKHAKRWRASRVGGAE